ncbi:MAG: flagellar basal-body MS-ring/collar protein FliF [bacterium]|nr:flagellar basal-body MS-ring/collar protein FliF [bacterium]
MNKYFQLFQDFFGPLSNAQRMMFIGLFVVILGMIGGLFYWSQQEDQMLLFGGLESETAQEIVTELETRGIKYSLQDGGRSIYVPSDRVHELRLDLAPMGGGFTDIQGYELFDTNALGMTDFMQEVNKKRALEGELARSINSLEQVESSRLHIVLPERSPFDETTIQASASVILNLKANRSLTPDQIEGITALIAGSVEELEPTNITILDQAGNRLTDEIDYESEFTMGTTQMQLRQKTEAYLTDRGQSMLDRVLGAGNSILRVSVEHSFDRITRESDLIDPDSRTVISEEKREQTNNDQQREPVPIDNLTPIDRRQDAIVVQANDNSNVIETRNYEVNRTREVYEKGEGEINRITASVLLNYKQVKTVNEEGEEMIDFEPYSPEEVQQFREAVELAIGVKPERGDLLTINQSEFFTTQYVSGNAFMATQPVYSTDIIRWVVIGITFGVILFLINGIRKKMSIETEMAVNSNFQGNTELPAGATMQSLPAGAQGGAAMLEPAFDEDGNPIEPTFPAEAEAPAEPEATYNKDEIKEFVELKPAMAAQILRAMMSPDED